MTNILVFINKVQLLIDFSVLNYVNHKSANVLKRSCKTKYYWTTTVISRF